jgi:hypothetical protein
MNLSEFWTQWSTLFEHNDPYLFLDVNFISTKKKT